MTPTTSTTPFGISFTPNFANPPQSTVSLPTFTCTTGNNCNPRTVTFTPYAIGTYTVRIFASGTETQQSQSSNFQMTVTAGPMSPPHTVLTATASSVQAGTLFSFVAQLADQFGNLLTSGAGATFTFPAPTTPPGFSPPVVVNHNDGTFTINTTLYIAGPAVVIRPIINGVNTNGVTLAVTPGAIFGATSSVTPIQPDIYAGETSASVTVTLRDQYLNAVISSAGCALQLANNPAVTATFQQSGSTNVFFMSFTPTVADYSQKYGASVVCSGQALTNVNSGDATPQPVQVKPTTISSKYSSISAISTATAGTQAAFRLTLKDGFQNPWRTFKQQGPTRDQNQMTALYAATISYAPTRSFVGAIATIVHDDSMPGAGQYIVTFTPTYTDSTSPYTFTFTADGVAYTPNGLNPIVVAPGAAALAQSVYKSATPITAQPAHSTFSVKIALRDSFQNPITTGGIPVANFVVQYYQRYQAAYCLAGRKDTSHSIQSNFTSASNSVTDNSDGSYSISIQTDVAGSYWFDIAMTSGTLITDATCSGIPDTTAFTIYPLVAAPTHTVLSAITSGRAGDFMSFTVTLFDQYDNLVNPSTIGTGTGPYTVTTSTTPGLCTGANILTLANSAGVITPPTGTAPIWTVNFQVNVTALYFVPVTVNNALAAVDASHCPSVFVKPGYINQVNFVSSQNVTAGIPATLTLQSADRFGNPIFSGGATATVPIFTATFTRGVWSTIYRDESVAVHWADQLLDSANRIRSRWTDECRRDAPS